MQENQISDVGDSPHLDNNVVSFGAYRFLVEAVILFSPVTLYTLIYTIVFRGITLS